MRKILVVGVVAILLTLGIAGGLVLIKPGARGWSASDLVLPSTNVIERPPTTFPGPLTDSYRASHWSLSWSLTDIYEAYGGVARVSLNNSGSSPLYVYELTLQWSDTNISSSRAADVLIQPGEKVEIGLLSFAAPSAGSHQYSIKLKLAVEHPNGDWYDYGTTAVADHSVTVLDRSSPTNNTVDLNSAQYYNLINELVDFSVTAPIAQDIRDRFPGAYGLAQVVECYEWVRNNIGYLADSGDYWQSANETLSRGTGDCEDQAILFASLVGELGGNAKVNVIEGHAFPTVYVCSNASMLPSVRASIASYYWVNVTDLHLTFLTDERGIWLVMDPVGTPYAGGLPSLSAPSSLGLSADDWTFESATWCHEIDATGKTANGWLPFL